MVAFVLAETGVVAITKVAFRAPAGTTTFGGTSAEVRFDAKVIVVSTAATPVRFTVPIDSVPPNALVGFKVNGLNAGGLTVSVAEVLVIPRYVADTVPVVALETGTVSTANVTVFTPAGTVNWPAPLRR